MEEETTLRFSLRVPKELHERLTASANDHGNSLNAEMLRLLEVGLKKDESKAPDKTLVEQLLPPAMVWRVRRFRNAQNLPSNEEAAKRLIKFALDDRESTKDILEKLHEAFDCEKDLRILAKDVIASHGAMANIKYGKDYVWFVTNSDESGAIDRKGKLYFSEDGRDWDCGMNYYTPCGDEAPKASDQELDDEIPF
ncbi:Arc family DNA-binding protein [Acetobacter pasteurianus]|uniref:Arc family DNA-binding protein n=1 Tax=Acetobacter pasteurianus TaxID=438 RepID=UPI003D0C84E9